jgi:hypothetical protein
MKSIFNISAFLVSLIIVSLVSQPGSAKTYLTDFDENQAQLLMLQAINTVRYHEGLPLVSLDDDLSVACQRHAMDMAHRDYFGHFSPEGFSPDDRARNAGLPNPISENIGIIRTFGQDLPQVIDALMQSFLGSPEHRANLLNPDLTHVGLGFFQDVEGTNHRLEVENNPDSVYRGFGTVLVVQDFYKRRVTLLEPMPYSGWTKPGEFMTFRLDFSEDVEEAFLRITPRTEPAESYDVPMSVGDKGFRARFAIDDEGEFNIGIYASSPSSEWYYREQGHLLLTVKSQ